MTLKYESLADSLKEEIFQRGPKGDRKLPTEAELMRTYCVSRQTVRQALSILLKDGLIEKRQGSGTYIAPDVFPDALSSNTIALLMPESAGYLSSHETQEMHAVFQKADYMVQIYSTENRAAKEREILESILAKPVRGMLVQGVRTAFPNPNLSLYKELVSRGTSIIFIGDAYPGTEEAVRISFDDFRGGEMLASHLIRLGHKKIAGIFCLDNQSGRNRYAGVLHALSENHLPFDDRDFLWYDTLNTRAPDSRLLLAFLQVQLVGCTAVICQDSQLAGRVLSELNHLSIPVPQRVSVAAFRLNEQAESGLPRITCVKSQEERPWVHAANTLLAMTEGRAVSSFICPWVLCPGKSTAPPE